MSSLDNVAAMNQKRQRYDPLATSSATRWLVRVDEFRNVVAVLELPAGTDLRQALADGMESLRREGWEIEGVSFSGTFVTRGCDRHNLSILPTDPGKPLGEMWGARR
jgi:hypothetical protein